MPANESLKPASGQVASRNPSAATSQPSVLSKPSQPSVPSSNRPVLPIAVLTTVLLIFFGGLFVYRFVFKKTIFTPGAKEEIQVSPSPSPVVFTPVGDIVSVDVKESKLRFRLKGSKVEYTVKLVGEVMEASSGAKSDLSRLKKGQTIEVTSEKAPIVGQDVEAKSIRVYSDQPIIKNIPGVGG